MSRLGLLHVCLQTRLNKVKCMIQGPAYLKLKVILKNQGFFLYTFLLNEKESCYKKVK